MHVRVQRCGRAQALSSAQAAAALSSLESLRWRLWEVSLRTLLRGLCGGLTEIIAISKCIHIYIYIYIYMYIYVYMYA